MVILIGIFCVLAEEFIATNSTTNIIKYVIVNHIDQNRAAKEALPLEQLVYPIEMLPDVLLVLLGQQLTQVW